MKLKFINDKDLSLILRAFKYVLPHKTKFIIALVSVLFSICLGLIQPILWAKLLTGLFGKNFDVVLTTILNLIVLYVVQSTVGFIQQVMFTSVNESIIYEIKKDLFDKILNLPTKAFDEIKTGEYISRLHGDAATLANIITNQLLNAVIDIIKVIIIGGIVFSINIWMALIILLTFPVSSYVFLLFGKKIRIKNREILKLSDLLFGNMQESM